MPSAHPTNSSSDATRWSALLAGHGGSIQAVPGGSQPLFYIAVPHAVLLGTTIGNTIQPSEAACATACAQTQFCSCGCASRGCGLSTPGPPCLLVSRPPIRLPSFACIAATLHLPKPAGLVAPGFHPSVPPAVFNFCPSDSRDPSGGCQMDPALTIAPPGACYLLQHTAIPSPSFMPLLGNGSGVPTTAGAPLVPNLLANVPPSLPGYTGLLGFTMLGVANVSGFRPPPPRI